MSENVITIPNERYKRNSHLFSLRKKDGLTLSIMKLYDIPDICSWLEENLQDNYTVSYKTFIAHDKDHNQTITERTNFLIEASPRHQVLIKIKFGV